MENAEFAVKDLPLGRTLRLTEVNTVFTVFRSFPKDVKINYNEHKKLIKV